MMICERCDHVFKDYDAVTVYDDPSPAGVALPSGAYEYRTCPNCGSDEIEDAEECPSCGSYFLHGESILCDDCAQELAQELEKIRVSLDISTDDFEEAIANNFGW